MLTIKENGKDATDVTLTAIRGDLNGIFILTFSSKLANKAKELIVSIDKIPMLQWIILNVNPNEPVAFEDKSIVTPIADKIKSQDTARIAFKLYDEYGNQVVDPEVGKKLSLLVQKGTAEISSYS